MKIVTIEEAQARLPELIAALPARQELVIASDGRSIAQLAVTPISDVAPVANPSSALDLPTYSCGKVLKPRFDRFEVFEEMIRRED